MVILGVDPGETTGLVLMNTEDQDRTIWRTVRGWNGIDDLLDQYEPDLIVMEAFRLYPMMAQTLIGSDFPTVQVIGAIRYMAELREIPVAMQTAAIAKSYAKQCSVKTNSPHIRSAWGHAECYRKVNCL